MSHLQCAATLLPLVLLCSLAVAASAHNQHSHSSDIARRLLAKPVNKGGSDQKGAGSQASWHSGKKFDFSDESGGAKGYLRRLRNKDKAKHDRLLNNSGWNNKKTDDIADQLDQDADLVRVTGK